MSMCGSNMKRGSRLETLRFLLRLTSKRGHILFDHSKMMVTMAGACEPRLGKQYKHILFVRVL